MLKVPPGIHTIPLGFTAAAGWSVMASVASCVAIHDFMLFTLTRDKSGAQRPSEGLDSGFAAGRLSRRIPAAASRAREGSPSSWLMRSDATGHYRQARVRCRAARQPPRVGPDIS